MQLNKMHLTTLIYFYFSLFIDLKAAPKYGRSPSMPANPSPMGTPQRRAAETQQSQVCKICLFFFTYIFSLLQAQKMYFLNQFLAMSNRVLRYMNTQVLSFTRNIPIILFFPLCALLTGLNRAGLI